MRQAGHTGDRVKDRAGAAKLGGFAVLLVLLVSLASCAASRADERETLNGVALIIGQSNYEHLGALANPGSDARKIEAMLSGLGFKTQVVLDRTAAQLRRDLEGFTQDAEGADVAQIFYAGHGIEAGGVTYLVPTDADLSSLEAAEHDLVSLTWVIDDLRSKVGIAIVLLDACRNNPFPEGAVLKTRAAPHGLPITRAGLGAPRGAFGWDNQNEDSDGLGVVIGYAAEPGKVAYDGDGTSPYAAALLKHFATPGMEFGDVMTLVTEEVYLQSGGRQRPWTNTSLRRFLYFGGEPQQHGADAARLIQARGDLLLSVRDTPAGIRDLVERVAERDSLPLDILYGMLKELEVDTSAGLDRIEEQLRAGALSLNTFMAQRVIPVRSDEELIRLSVLADRAQDEGAIGLAREYRAQASARADELDKVLGQGEARLAERRLELATVYAEEAQTAVLAFDHQTAAGRYSLAYRQIVRWDEALAFRYKLREADARFDHGRYKGGSRALSEAIQAYRQALAHSSRANAPDDWATAQNNLGNALRYLGASESGTVTLRQAIAAYELALEERTRDRAPRDWAATQTSLGNALTILGTREGGTATLKRAITFYEAALEVQTRSSVPRDRAKTQVNLANALQRLGSRESGNASLIQAISLYQEALDVMTRDGVPIDWSQIQNNLGSVFHILGQRESGTGMLRKALAAHEAALEERRREIVPLELAMTQRNLGLTLAILAERENSISMLFRAVAAFEAALQEWTRGRNPRGWAQTQYSLGNALLSLGDQESGSATLQRAAVAYEEALKEYSRDQDSLDWASIKNKLAGALLLLGQRKKDADLILRGRRCVQSAWDARKSAGDDGNAAYFAKRLATFDAALATIGDTE